MTQSLQIVYTYQSIYRDTVYRINRIIGEHYIWCFAQKTLLVGF